MRTLLITAGPSREYFDDVRFLSNASSGQMGIAVAEKARERGWHVQLALGPVEAQVPAGIDVHRYTSARELDEICQELWPEVDAFVATAAVCDYRPQQRVTGKRKKDGDDWALTLVRNPDVLLERSKDKGERTLVGFALEPHFDLSEAKRKLEQKSLDLILLNTPHSLGQEKSHYHWLAPDTHEDLGAIDKPSLAERIVDFLGDRVSDP